MKKIILSVFLIVTIILIVIIMISPNLRHTVVTQIKQVGIDISNTYLDYAVKKRYLHVKLQTEITCRAWTKEEIDDMLERIDVEKDIYNKIEGVSSDDIRQGLRKKLFSVGDLASIIVCDPNRFKGNTLSIGEIAKDIKGAESELGFN